jgi:hypothetical protein
VIYQVDLILCVYDISSECEKMQVVRVAFGDDLQPVDFPFPPPLLTNFAARNGADLCESEPDLKSRRL